MLPGAAKSWILIYMCPGQTKNVSEMGPDPPKRCSSIGGPWETGFRAETLHFLEGRAWIFPQLGFALGVLTYLVKDCCNVQRYSPDPPVPRRGALEEPQVFDTKNCFWALGSSAS